LATKVPMFSAMANRGCVVLLGDFSNERLDLAALGRDFGWSLDRASDLSGLAEIGRSRTVIAVLIQAGTLHLSWHAVMRAVRAVAPRARIIVCHKVDQAHSRAEMVDSGAFGVLLSPLAYSEVRQSLGFVWASKITPLEHASSTARKTSPKTSLIEGKVRRVGAA
jgi:DNA-binding NtrC family response regulator